MNPTLPCINGYQLVKDWSTTGNARWSYAKKDGKQYFIKVFLAPKYKRIEDGFSTRQIESGRIRCEAFKKSQEDVYRRIQKANNGNIITIHDFFNFDCQFYAVSEKVDVSSLSISAIAKKPHVQKLILLKVITHSIDCLHTQGVIHADLKPDNILIKKTLKGHTLKLIDFDASFSITNPRRGKQIAFDYVFMAPETALALSNETITLTPKIDIFALGLLFHLYYCGKLPQYPEGYSNASSAVSDSKSLKLDSNLPEWLKTLIEKMTDVNPKRRPSADIVFQVLSAEDCAPLKNRLHTLERISSFP